MMSIKVLTILCIEAFFVQNVLSQLNGCGAITNPGYPAIDPYTYPASPPYGTGAPLAPNQYPTAANIIPTDATLVPAGESVVVELVDTYGGAGLGEVLVLGDMPVQGNTMVAGQVPILGSVRFAGDVPASGVISLTGTCGCNCGFNNVIVNQ